MGMQQQTPIMVQVVESPVESTSIADVLVGSLGLTGALLLAAVILGALLGGVLIGIKVLRARWNLEPESDLDAFRVTPGGTR